MVCIGMIMGVSACSPQDSTTSSNKSSSRNVSGYETSESELSSINFESEPSQSTSNSAQNGGGDSKSSSKLSSNSGSVASRVSSTVSRPATGTESGDTTFKLVTSNLPKNTLYVISTKVLSVEGVMQHDIARLITSLQGLINREYETNKVFLYWSDLGQDEFWKTYLQQPGKLFSGLKEVHINSFENFLLTFHKQLKDCGLIIWDPKVPATSNVAATICGLDGFLPVKYDTEKKGLMNRLLEAGIKQKQTLVGLFTGKGNILNTDIKSTGSAKNDAYLWAMEKYMDRCSNKFIAYMPDGASTVADNPIYTQNSNNGPQHSSLYNHDYLIARRCFFVDLSCVGTELPADDKTQPMGTDLATLKRILQKRYDMAGGEFGQCIGFIPWWLKYTSAGGWGSLRPTTVEWMFSELLTAYNLEEEADAAMPCWISNTSAYYKSPKKTSYKQNTPKVTKRFDSNTTYVLYYLGDYDSSAWLKNHIPTWWKDPAKNSMPNMWAFNPNMIDRVPIVFDYIYENLGPNDYIVTGDSGAGYVIPESLYQYGSSVRTLPDGDQAWLKFSQPYLKLLNMDYCGFIINSNYVLSNRAMDLYSQMFKGCFHNTSSRPLVIYKGVPFVYLQNELSRPAAANDRAKAMYQFIKTTMKSYNFAAFRTVVFSPTQIKQTTEAFLNYTEDVDPGRKYEFVDIHTFMDLIKQSGQGTIVN